ncbi:Transcriptional regulator calD [Cladobotryum mycophilum]|uniref:Transcriptional regulator calD n=1 Tax=Cladobotryum mycophilum TaxID=491253 RepID=A0ABR0SPG6_9HYPO
MDQFMPLHFFDDTPLLRSMVLHLFFAFNDVLDPQKLHYNLEALARRDGWQKLGARLRRRNGRLEYHIPKEYTDKCPAIMFRHTEHNMKVSSHPIASQLPTPTTKASIVLDPDIFKSLAYHPSTPQRLQDYLNADIPQLSLHVISFTDATFVSLNWPHVMCDVIGIGSVLKGWTAMLKGRPEEVPRLYGTETDPLVEFGLHAAEAHKLESQHASIMRVFSQYGLRNLSGFLFGTRKRLVCIPSSFISQLREDALEVLKKDDPSQSKLFLSDGDIICAWWSRMVASQLTQDPNQTLVINNIQSLRAVLSPDLIPSGLDYVSNGIGLITTLIPMKVALQDHLGFSASRIRHSIIELGTRAQAEAYAALLRASRYKLHPAFGDKSSQVVTYTNLTKGKLFHIDLSAAIVEGTQGSKPQSSTKPGTPCFMEYWQGFKYPTFFAILGKDAAGNHWLSGNLRNSVWKKLEVALAEDRGDL